MVKRILLFGLLLVVVVVGVSNFTDVSILKRVHLPALFSRESTAETQVKGFVQAMQKKDYKNAQSYLTKSALSAYDTDRLAQTPMAQGKYVLVSSELKKKSRSNITLVTYKIVDKDNSENSQVAELFLENGIWKIGFFGPDEY